MLLDQSTLNRRRLLSSCFSVTEFLVYRKLGAWQRRTLDFLASPFLFSAWCFDCFMERILSLVSLESGTGKGELKCVSDAFHFLFWFPGKSRNRKPNTNLLFYHYATLIMYQSIACFCIYTLIRNTWSIFFVYKTSWKKIDQNFFVRLFIFPINQKLNTLVNSLSNDQ